MDLHTKRRIDHILGSALLVVIRLLARLLGFVLRRSHDVAPVRAVLVAKFQGIGSLMIARPGIQRVRRAYPEAMIVFWGSPDTAALAREMVEFDEVIVLDDTTVVRAGLAVVSNLLLIWRIEVDWAFDLEVYSKLSSVLITMTGARNRAGFAVDTARLRRNSHTHLLFFNRYLYLGTAYERLLALCLDAADIAGKSPLSACPGETLIPVWRFQLEPLPALRNPYVVLNLHAGPLSLERCWSIQAFGELIDRILRSLEHAGDSWTELVLIGHGDFEVRKTASIPAHPRIRNLAGTLSLTETIRCLQHARLLVSSDTAALHLTVHTAVPIVGLFGPTRAETYLPPGRPQTWIIRESIYCSPCIHHWDPPPCAGDNQCMQRIRVSTVLRACLEALGIQPVASMTDAPERAEAPHSEYYAGLVHQS